MEEFKHFWKQEGLGREPWLIAKVIELVHAAGGFEGQHYSAQEYMTGEVIPEHPLVTEAKRDVHRAMQKARLAEQEKERNRQ